ncbi:NAD(P)H-dependent flavin oxidoreductase [Dyadobacter aurulentus]|uniref:NAD(P)H-dependent flavin oxidoreductase n=1 Tax=Dyadobacter sp. UC 10 TaxID=2605428 RepID=UPI0011F1C77C|nr:nitronate monooxygenase [Dyadobacter sp. UC 10]KAA0989194.1 nitronate monooxygenase [Dyadobacter sp. UC 10]
MWNQTSITQLLGIRYPIFQGPMGGGFSTPELLAAVSNAGGLGSLGAYTLDPGQIRQFAQTIKSQTDKPYNINLWVSDVDADLTSLSAETLERVTSLFKPYYDALSIPLPELNPNIASRFERQVEAIFEIRPAVFSFIFGVPSSDILSDARRLGIKTVGAATTLDEALLLEEAKVDAIVAAGFEAGGHRPSFLRPALDSLTGTFSLVQQLKASIKTPVIAAGGITDGKGIVSALTMGADAVQLGTAFLVTDESNATPLHKAALLSGESNNTVLSKSLTGRLGRMIRNTISEEIPNQVQVLPFPLQTRLVAPLREAALAQGRRDMVNFWSGQSPVHFKHKTAAALMQALVTETEQILRSGPGL